MTEQQLQAIRDRATKPVPWLPLEYETGSPAEFIAHAREDVSTLLAYVEWLEGIIADAQKDQTELFRGERQRGREEMWDVVRSYLSYDDVPSLQRDLKELPPAPAVPETIQALRGEVADMTRWNGLMLGILRDAMTWYRDNVRSQGGEAWVMEVESLLNGSAE